MVILNVLNLFISLDTVNMSQVDDVVLQVPHFASSVYKSTHFGLSFAYDATVIGMIC